MQNHSLPLLFFAFANDKTRPLHAIPKEFNELDNLLLTKKQLCEAQFKPNISAYDFHHVISALGKDIYIIHYGGHTDGYQTVFTDENQDASPFHGSGFVEMIKALPHLQLVFINGCNSAQMVNELYDAGVPVVIGTTHNVQDAIAYELSVAFYKGLANQNTIAAAWTQAAALIKGQYKKDIRFRGVSFDDEDIDRDNSHAAWFIRIKEGAGDWGLHLVRVRNSQRVPNSNQMQASSFPPLHNAKDFSLAHPTIGRDKDLTAVCNMLAEQQQCIVVNGIGGIGKSTLVKYYIQQYKAQYQHIIWLQEKETAVNILLDDSIFLTHLGIYEQVLAFKNASNQTAALELTLSKLNELPKQTLLVADNVSDLNGFEIICNALDKDIFHILATSRKQTGNFAFHELDHLSLPDAKDLFVSHCKQKTKGNPHAQKALLENPALERILAKIDYHTLTIEIIAKIYNNSKTLTLESLEQKLQKAILNPKLPQTAYTHYTQKEATILETILAAFDIGGLSQQTEALDILAQWAVLPATPIPLEHLIALFGIDIENEDAFDKTLTFLTDNAWIQQDKATANSYACHALIQEAVRWQLNDRVRNFLKVPNSIIPDDFDYTPLIDRLSLLFHYEAGDNLLEKTIWLPYAESVINKSKIKNKEIITLLNNLVKVFTEIGNYNKGILYAKISLNLAIKILSPNDSLLAASYSYNSVLYRKLEQCNIALDYAQKAIDIQKKLALPNDIYLATYYDNIANVYNCLGNPKQALIFNEKNLTIILSINPQPLRELAKSYTNLSTTHWKLKDNQQALDYDLKALEIKQKICLPNDPSLAQSYNNTGISFHNLGKLDDAYFYYLQALEIREEIFTSPHLALAESYYNMGNIFKDKEEYNQSLQYHFKALEIRKESLHSESESLGQSNQAIAVIYYYLQNYIKSLAYFKKAIQIWRKSLPKEHSNIKSAVDNMAYVFQVAVDAGQMEEAKEYALWYVNAMREDIE